MMDANDVKERVMGCIPTDSVRQLSYIRKELSELHTYDEVMAAIKALRKEGKIIGDGNAPMGFMRAGSWVADRRAAVLDALTEKKHQTTTEIGARLFGHRRNTDKVRHVLNGLLEDGLVHRYKWHNGKEYSWRLTAWGEFHG